jgi:phage terminase large subunit-like protein
VWKPDENGVVAAKVFLWLPSDRLAERANVAQVRLDVWAADGYIETTPGAVVDFDHVERRIVEIVEEYRPRTIGFDPWNATQLMSHLRERFGDAADAPKVVEVRQGFQSLSAPTKELLRLVGARKLAHGGNPALRWMASNLVTREDPAGNLKPDRQRSAEKIDGLVALLMALFGLQGNLGAAPAEDSGPVVWSVVESY